MDAKLYYISNGWDRGTLHRVDYDKLESLAIKSACAAKIGARGVGVWTADLLNYSNETLVRAFWDAFKPFTVPAISAAVEAKQ